MEPQNEFTVFVTNETCWKCDGSGRLRANYTNADGKYVFHKTACDECGGLGHLDYQKCADCGDMVPVYLFKEHECEN